MIKIYQFNSLYNQESIYFSQGFEVIGHTIDPEKALKTLSKASDHYFWVIGL